MSLRLKQLLPISLMLLILILAAGLRFYNLSEQSLWYDEGVAFGHSQRNLFEMIPRLQNNVHVPAYFASLALWEDFTGSSEFSLRYYSALWSIISVAAIYALGKRLFHPIAALAAAFFLACNGFSIYYAQEARMYAMLAAIATLSFWAFVKWAQIAMQPYAGAETESPNTLRRLWLWGLAFALLNTIGEYTHFSYALVMLSQGIMALLLLLNLAGRAIQAKIPFSVLARAFGIYTLVNLLSLILFAPWIGIAISQTSSQPNISDVLSLAEVLRIIQGWFAFGISFEVGIGGMAGVMYFLLLFGLISIPNSRKHAWWAMLLPIIFVLVSVGAYLGLELYARYLRFLLPAQIGFMLWLGRGIWSLWSILPRSENISPLRRKLPKFAAVIATLAFAWTEFSLLNALYHDAAYQRDDYRGLVASIESQASENDTIILSAPGLQEIFGYYYDGAAPVYPLPASEAIAADTQAVIANADTIFVIFYGQAEQDPNGLVETTLNSEAYQISSEWYGDIRFERYASPAEFSRPTELNLLFGENISLESYALSATSLQPNDVLQLQLQWSTNAILETRYKVFLQLLNADGVLVAQRDSEPSGNQALTTLWQIGETIVDNHALALDNLPLGDYTLIIGLYDANTGARLLTESGDYFVLAQIIIGE